MKIPYLAALATGLLLHGCSPPASPTASPARGGPTVSGSPQTSPAESATSAESATPSGTPLSSSADIKAQSEQLAAKLLDRSSASRELRVKGNGPAFVYLARISEDPKITAAALHDMNETYTTLTTSKDKNLVDAAYLEALSRGLGSADGPTLYWALRASTTTSSTTRGTRRPLIC